MPRTLTQILFTRTNFLFPCLFFFYCGSAQVNLGRLWEQGLGGEQSYEKMREWWELAATQDNGDAQRNLGLMWDNSWGVKRDAKKTRDWWVKASAQGHEAAIQNLFDLDVFEGKKVKEETDPLVEETDVGPR